MGAIFQTRMSREPDNGFAVTACEETKVSGD